METDDYLDSMIISLDKKEETLESILSHTKEQEKLLHAAEFDSKAFLYHMDEKDQLIKFVNVLDDGFDKTYDLVKEQLKSRPGLYKKQIDKLQDEIRKLTDLGVEIEATERRNLPLVEKAIHDRKEKIKKYNVSQKVVSEYYRHQMR